MKKVLNLLSLALAVLLLAGCVKNLDYCVLEVQSDNPAQGTVLGGGVYECGSEVIICASANPGYMFSRWNDGTLNNPHTFTLSDDATYTAYFGVSGGNGSYSVTFGSTTWSLVNPEL